MQQARHIHRAATLAVTLVFIAGLLLSLAQVLGLYRIVPVLSGSMSGFVETGDAAVLRPVDVTELGRGDVLAFYPPLPQAQLTLHRIVEIDRSDGSTVVRTAGDANAAPDPWRARLDDGTAWRANGVIVDGVGGWVIALQRPFVRLAVLAAVVIVFLIAVLRRIWRPTDLGVDDGTTDDRDESTPVQRSEPAVEAMKRPPVGSLLVIVLVVVGVAAATRLVSGPGANASLTTVVTAGHTVSTSWDAPPTEPEAALVCDLGIPTAVLFTWTAPTSGGELGYVVERGSAPDGAFAPIGRTLDTQYVDEAVDAVLAGEQYYRVRALTADGTTPPTEAVTLLAVCPSIAPPTDPEPPVTDPSGTEIGGVGPDVPVPALPSEL